MLDIVDVLAVREVVRGLSKRHQQICELLMRGHTHKEIAQLLGVKRQTVTEHVEHLRRAFRKSGFGGRAWRGSGRRGGKGHDKRDGRRADGESRRKKV